jgi:hypothetical protein
MSANIVLSLSSTKLEVAPGESVEATVTIRNQSQIVDQFGIRIQGLDPTWWTLSTSSISLFPGDQGEAKLTIHPPKEAESKAGSYSFQVRTVSQANPEEMTEEEAYLVLRGFLVWDVEMSPTKVAGRSGTYRITANNSGNTDMTLIFEGKDPEEALDYTFSHNKVTVPAGESALITLKVRPRKEERDKLYSFQVLVRPAGAEASSKEVKTINGKLEYKRRRFPWKWILLGVAIVVVAVLVWKFVLQLPVINSFTADPTSINAGSNSTLSWDVSGATTVTINQEVEGVDLDASTGTFTVSPTTTTNYTLEASNAVGRSRTRTVTVTVILPPNIVFFKPEPEETTQTAGSTLSWDVSGATVVTVSCVDEVWDESAGLDPTKGELWVNPQNTTIYTMEASNKAGNVTRSVTVSVPVPEIKYFGAYPGSLNLGGKTELRWMVSDATKITISTIVEAWTFYTLSDTYEVEPGLGKTIYTLTAENWAGEVTDTAEVVVYMPYVIIEPIAPPSWWDLITTLP